MLKLLRGLILLAVVILLASFPTRAQELDPVTTWQVRVNQARLDEGLAPYGFSSLLTAAAQRHADDLAANGFTNPDDVHQGSDGSHEQQRAKEAGYAAWTWNSEGLRVDENVWSGHGTVEDAITFFMDDLPHRNNILNSTYREIGVGVAVDDAGRNYYVLDFGVRPNVLPIFINDGASSTTDPNIAIRLTNEKARPEGEGTTFMGRAIEIRISNEPEWSGLPWQSWEPLVPWTLPQSPGKHTVYVQFRDAAGRKAASPDTIFLSEGTPATPTPAPSSPTPEPTVTSTPVSSTATPTSPPSLTSAPELSPTAEAPVAPTAPQATPSLPPSPTPLPLPMTPSPTGATPFPTWTPLPTAAPQKSQETVFPFSPLVVLQGAALILGLYLALRRGRNGESP